MNLSAGNHQSTIYYNIIKYYEQKNKRLSIIAIGRGNIIIQQYYRFGIIYRQTGHDRLIIFTYTRATGIRFQSKCNFIILR